MDAAPRCSLDVTSNEPLDGTGDGNTADAVGNESDSQFVVSVPKSQRR